MVSQLSVIRPESLDLQDFEKDEAQLIQCAMLPREALRTPIIEISYRFRTFEQVGGDFLDYFILSDGNLGFYMGDVVGKGLSAAMYAALAMGTLRGIHKSGVQPSSVLELFNRRLSFRAVPRRYCASQYATFDPASRELRISNAGLPLPVHISGTGCRALGAGGLPSGLFDGSQYEQSVTPLAPGDAVIFATDGIYEARDPYENEFGVERMIKLCSGWGKESANGVLDRLFDGLERFSAGHAQDDDMTAVALKVSSV